MQNKDKTILDLCGGTGAWSKSYKDASYTVYNITLPDYDIRKWQSIPEIMQHITEKGEIYGVLAAPPCTKFSKADWRTPKEKRDFKTGMETVKACMNLIWKIQENGAPLKFWALENPMGYLYNFMGFPHFYFQPWQFGEKGMLATKRTALWGYFNKPVKTVRVRKIPFIKEKQNHEWYGASTEKRAMTPSGFAKAFFKANQ